MRDVAALVELIVTDQAARGQTVKIGGPDSFTLDELARKVADGHGDDTKPRHVPRAALHIMAATMGRLHPELGRHARAALAMDRDDMTFDSDTIRTRFASRPCTPADELLAMNITQHHSHP